MATKWEKVNNFIKRGEEILRSDYHVGQGIIPSSISGTNFDTWMGEINIFNERYLKQHPLHRSIFTTYFHRSKRSKSSCEDMIGHLRALAADEEFFDNDINDQNNLFDITKKESGETSIDKKLVDLDLQDKDCGRKRMSNKVFIVHGHDDAAKLEMARTLEKAGLEPIILHEQASGGGTIIEKLEANTDVAFAVVLYTPCDYGYAKSESDSAKRSRARQNVVFEHGYLIAKLGRQNVCALVKERTETPGDISGVVYIDMDQRGAWKMELSKEMQNTGLQFNRDKFLS